MTNSTCQSHGFHHRTLPGIFETFATDAQPITIVHTLSPNELTPATHSAEPVLGEGTKIGGCYVLRRNLSKPDARPVWLASDEVLGKDVTLHFVPAPVAADARAMTELRQEVKRNRQLIHPNILRVYDFVEDGSHVAISMDEFDGESLQDMLKRKGTLDPADLKPWIAQLAETLADAHRIQLFHRDLSPENICLRPNGGLLVANFGISRVILNSLERAGLAKGNAAHLAYLSPQQIDGDRPNASDDIYGFGVLMHTLLGGAPTFAGDDILPQIRKTIPKTVSEVRAAAGVTVPVSAAWEKLVATCLEKNPEARPRNLTEVLTLLGQDSAPARVQPAQVAPAAEAVVPSVAAQSLAGLDAPLKKAGAHGDGGNGAAAAKHSDAVAASNEAAAAGKPLHPEIPPVGPLPAVRKAPAKGALSANFPDLERPRSKAPLVWLLLAAGIIGGGIYMRNKPEPVEGEGNDAISRVDPENPGGEKVPSSSDGGSLPKPSDSLPDPVPVPSPRVGTTAQTGGTVAISEPPKVEVTPALKPAKPPTLIGSDPNTGVKPVPATPVPARTLVPGSFDGLGIGKGTPEPRKPAMGKPPETLITEGSPKVEVGVSVKPPGGVPVKPEVTPVPVPTKTKAPDLFAAEALLPMLPAPIQPLPPLALPAKATMAQLDSVKKQRQAAIESIRGVAAVADGVHQEAGRRLEIAKLEKDKLQKELEAKRKTSGPVIQQAASLAAERAKLEMDAHARCV